ncbi:MAG: dTDP-4-dehydrorhamnose reductase [Cryomorphaceae bacterium]|jgi:dTDP-4-dehydrorhamnose reductase
MKSVLLIGQNGQVTTYLQRILSDDFKLIVAGRSQLDLSKIDSIRVTLENLNPDIVVNPAAYTAVDLAEQESELAFCINRDAVAEIAAYCAATNTPLIHFSTDYVFAGDASEPYVETDDPAPTGVYGESKLAGEQAIISSGAPAIILRTSWVYSNHGKNFYQTMLNLAQNRSELSVVADQFGAPTYAGSIADAALFLLQIIDRQGELKPAQMGIFHFSCGGQTNWCDFAKSLFVANGVDHMVVNAIVTSEYPTPAKRPAFSVLDCAKLEREFGVALPQWQAALEHCAAETKTLL